MLTNKTGGREEDVNLPCWYFASWSSKTVLSLYLCPLNLLNLIYIRKHALMFVGMVKTARLIQFNLTKHIQRTYSLNMCFICQKCSCARSIQTEKKPSAHTERDHFSPYCVIELIARLHLEHHMGFSHFILKGSLGGGSKKKGDITTLFNWVALQGSNQLKITTAETGNKTAAGHLSSRDGQSWDEWPQEERERELCIQ